MYRRISKALVEFSVIFAFINGLFAAIGFTPEAKFFTFIQPFIEGLPWIGKVLFAILPMLITLITVARIYNHGKLRGLLAVLIGFIAGLAFPTNIPTSLGILLLGMIIGYFAFQKE